MLYTIGSRVKLKATGDTGLVSKILGEDLVEVRLDGGFGHIPVPVDSLTYEHDLPPDGEKTDGARYVSGKKKVKEEVEPEALKLGYTILKPWGIQLAFDPVLDVIGESPDRYRLFLINDTRMPVIFQLRLEFPGRPDWSRVGKLAGSSFSEIGELRHPELNEQPIVDLEVRRQLSGGTGPKLQRRIKLKPKQFFKQIRTAPLLNRRVHHYVLIEDLTAPASSPKTTSGESLSSLTRREAGKLRPNVVSFSSGIPNPGELAAFPREIDLHLEALVKDPTRIPKGSRLSTQLAHFNAYMQQAHRLGVDQVFVIHGVGEGKLKAAVHTSLKRMSYVKSFANEWYERYGNGATRVEL